VKWPKSDSNHLIVNAKQMEGLEKEILSSGLPVEALMEKVGQRMSSWLLGKPHLLDKGVIVLVGPGHNGGDGLVVARELYLAGVKVSIWCPFSLNKSLTKKHLLHSNWLGIEELENEPDPSKEQLWIEALFGIGQNRPLPKTIVDLLAKRHQKQPGNLISLDVPAGICSDSGAAFNNQAAKASYTLTVGFIKQGLIQDIALDYVGQLVRIDFGFSEVALNQLSNNNCSLRIYSKDLDYFRWPQLSSKSTKYERGKVLAIAGSDQYRGAALLALQGVLSSGVGSVQACLPPLIADSLWQCLPEVVVKDILVTSNDGSGSARLKNCLQKINLDKYDSLLVGPGLGWSKEKWSDECTDLENFSGLLVLDADALNRIASSEKGWEWLKRRNGHTWITPHVGEFQRLFPEIDCSVPIQAALKAACLCEVTVLLKGANTVIATPAGEVWQITETAPWVARTGLGDVLAGFVAGVGAMGMTSKNEIHGSLLAACALMHAEAGKHCTKGSNASEIAITLASYFQNLQAAQLS
tara:strand:+ start:4462 stop:6033 length:1572 start_codon:yes stop_codon:yes gene_type:complete